MRKILALSAMALILSPVAVFADEEEVKHRPENIEKFMERMFDKNDKDGDGVISKEEFLANAEEKFKGMDKDGDGKLTKDEAKSHREEMRDKWKAKKEQMKQEKQGETVPEGAPQ